MSPTASSVFLVPRWVLVGAELYEGVMIVASNTLGQMEVEAIAKEIATDDNFFSRFEVIGYRIEGTMERFTVASGATWQKAFNNLMGTWSPEGTTPLLPIGEVQTLEVHGVKR